MTSSARSYPVHLPEDILNLTVEYIEKRVDILSLAKTHNCFRGIISVLHQFREINVSHINNSSLWVLLLNNPYLAWNVHAAARCGAECVNSSLPRGEAWF